MMESTAARTQQVHDYDMEHSTKNLAANIHSSPDHPPNIKLLVSVSYIYTTAPNITA
jgi:hypothetical protein